MAGIPYPAALPPPRTLTAVERESRFEGVEFDDGSTRYWPLYDTPAAGLELVSPLQFQIPIELVEGWLAFVNAWAYQAAGIELLGTTVVFTSSPEMREISGRYYLVEVEARTAT